MSSCIRICSQQTPCLIPCLTLKHVSSPPTSYHLPELVASHTIPVLLLWSADSLLRHAGNQFFELSDEICGDTTSFDTFEADECKLRGGSVTLHIER